MQQNAVGRERHGCRGDGGIYDPTGRDGNADQVIEQRPAQILPHRPAGSSGEPQRLRHPPDAPAGQHRVGTLNGNVCSRAHRDRKIRFRHGRGVVDPVAHHGDAAALVFQACDLCGLFLRLHLEENILDSALSCDAGCRFFLVAGDHPDLQPQCLTGVDSAFRVFAQRIFDPRLYTAFGQGSGFVEYDRINAPSLFHGRSSFEEDPQLRRPSGSRHQGCGRGETQCAGAGDHQHAADRRDRFSPVTGSEQEKPQCKDQRRKRDNRWDEDRGDPIRKALHGSFFTLRAAYKGRHLLQSRILAN